MPRSLSGLIIAGLLLGPAEAENDWQKVEDMLVGTQDAVVLDGMDPAPILNPNPDVQYGDWLVRHQLSDPQNLNPYTSSDAGATEVTGNIFETMLLPEHDPPFALQAHLAEGYPEISEDKLRTYNLTFDEVARAVSNNSIESS